MMIGAITMAMPAAADEKPAPETEAYRAEAGKLAGELGNRLREQLTAAMQAGGPLAAVAVCQERAVPIADAISNSNDGWEVGRTSLRVRNPDNAPDSWERSVLETFDRRQAAGETPATIEQEAVITVGEQRYYRYMKAITTGDACVLCHGSNIPPELQEHIGKLYPDDRATGYKAGDLRGAFTLTRRID
ncbi:MAG: DUF3365 domain-containing protein [Gammaproteobacteria bacterium]